MIGLVCLIATTSAAADPGAFHSRPGRVATRAVRPRATMRPTRVAARESRVPRTARPPRLYSLREAHAYMDRVARREARFLRPGVGYDARSGMTYDGHDIDVTTGQLRAGGPNNRSAASKESLHLIVLYKAIAGDPIARRLVSPDAPDDAPALAVEVLQRKIESYREFDRRFPGYGGFLPWYRIAEGRPEPLPDWTTRVPGLDNGQLAWSLYVVARGLREHGQPELAARYDAHVQRMARNVVRVFYDPEARLLRGEAVLGRGNAVAPARNRYRSHGYHIDDPYEGNLLYHFADLFGEWRGQPGGRAALWQRPRREPAQFESASGTAITVSRGHWHSSHEAWSFAVLPYVDVPIARDVFDNEQRMRTVHAADRGEWLKASTHRPQRSNAPLDYLNALGIADPRVTVDHVEADAIFAPYATFPLALAGSSDPALHDRALRVFATWLRTMTRAPRMWGPYGMGESFSGEGDAIAGTLTWDGKMLPLVAFMGGIVPETRRFLTEDGRYGRFVEHVERDYSRFDGLRLHGTSVPLATPSRHVPRGMPGFTRSARPAPAN